MREKAKEVAKLMGLMSNENRLLILCALIERPMTVGELSSEVDDISMSALSQHLQKLKSSDLIDSEKHGQFVTYHIKDERLRTLIALMKAEFCGETEQQG